MQLLVIPSDDCKVKIVNKKFIVTFVYKICAIIYKKTNRKRVNFINWIFFFENRVLFHKVLMNQHVSGVKEVNLEKVTLCFYWDNNANICIEMCNKSADFAITTLKLVKGKVCIMIFCHLHSYGEENIGWKFEFVQKCGEGKHFFSRFCFLSK
jgi:hypothetical protein